MINTLTLWRLAVHIGYWISSTGGIGKKKSTQWTLISLLWHTDILSIIGDGVMVEVGFSHGQDGIGWSEWKTTLRTNQKEVVGRPFAQANNGLLAGGDRALDTMNTKYYFEIMRVSEEWNLESVKNVDDILKMWQCSHNLWSRQKKSDAKTRWTAAKEYTSDTEEIPKVSWSNLQPESAAVFISFKRLLVPPALSAKNLAGGRTQILNVYQMHRLNHHSSESD